MKRTCTECGIECVGDLVFGLCEVCALQAAGRTGANAKGPAADGGPEARRFGAYVLGRQIGRGGMGVVYEAIQDRPNRLVALKMILDSASDSSSARSRFAIESETAARLEHPNIVPIFEVGEHEGQPFISMKRITGENLRRRIATGEFCLAKNATLPRVEQRQRAVTIARLMVKVALAVHYAHLHGVVHRDLKPANILVDDQGQPHLTDFGLAKLFGEVAISSAMALTGSGTLLGTPGYMSPEQADARPVTPASDIYSLGAILFEMLTGGPPFRAATLRETLRLVVEQEASAPSSRHRGIDPELDTICLKCLEKKPEARYTTAEMLADDLQRWIDGRPIGAHRVGYVNRTVRWVKRNRIATSLIASLCLCLVVSLVLLEERMRKVRQIADERAWVLERIAQKLDADWNNPAVSFIPIGPQDLAALGDRMVNAGSHALPLKYAMSIPFDPITAATKYSRFLGVIEKRMTRLLKRPVTFTLVLNKSASWDFDPHTDADVQSVSLLTLKRWKESEASIQALVKEVMDDDLDDSGAVIFARSDAGISRVTQLPGHKIGFAHTNSVTSALGKMELASLGLCAKMFQLCTNLAPPVRVIRLPEKEFAAELDIESFSHREVMAKVISGELDAGVAPARRFERMARRQTNLVVLHRFFKAPNIYIARPGLPNEIVVALRQSLLSIRDHELLGFTQSSMHNGFAPISDAEIGKFNQRVDRYLTWFESCAGETQTTNRTDSGSH